ncbi:PIR protein [Plasmodium vivax]|uniref:VIR protein n=1 Tax=Plasmodium vivax TaxID=5855 RepID=A0A565A458_PLAVI|nr:PIR protein [Plasmodium vivax]
MKTIASHFKDAGLKASKLFKFYQLLDSKKGTNNNNPASDADEQKKHLIELENHLKNIYNEWDNICKSTDCGKIKCSQYLKYWLYGKIAEKKLNFFRIRELNEYLNKLMKEKSYIINEKDCTRNFIKCPPIEVLHNKKVLYDFLEYYISINDELSKIDENTKGKYCKYIIHIFELYHKLYEEDRQWGLLQRYENELKLFRDKFTNEKELSSLKSKCNIDNSLVESFKNVKTTDFLEGNYLRGRAISTRYDNRFTKIKSEYVRYLI